MSGEEKALALSLRKQGYRIWQISRKMNYCMATIQNNTKECKKSYRKWSEEETVKLVEIMKNGSTYRNAGRILGRNFTSCQRKYEWYLRNASVKL